MIKGVYSLDHKTSLLHVLYICTAVAPSEYLLHTNLSVGDKTSGEDFGVRRGNPDGATVSCVQRFGLWFRF